MIDFCFDQLDCMVTPTALDFSFFHYDLKRKKIVGQGFDLNYICTVLLANFRLIFHQLIIIDCIIIVIVDNYNEYNP